MKVFGFTSKMGAIKILASWASHCRVGSWGRIVGYSLVPATVRGNPLPKLLLECGYLPGRDSGRGALFLVQRTRLVPIRLPPGRAHAHLRAVLTVPDFCGKKEMHFVQCLHLGLPSGH